MPTPQARAPELTPHEAVTQFERAAKENSDDAQAHFNLGSAYYVAHNLEAALGEFEAAVARQPDLQHAHYYLGVIYKARGDRERAQREFEQVLNSNAHIMLKNQARIQLQSLNGA